MAIKAKEKFEVFEEGDFRYFDKACDKIEKELKVGKYTVYLLDEKKNRSLQANRYYWGCCIKTLEQHCGIDGEDIHELLKSQFNKKKVILEGIDAVEIGESTKKMDTETFIRYIERIRAWAMESLECYIPLPSEVAEKDDFADLYVLATDAKI